MADTNIISLTDARQFAASPQAASVRTLFTTEHRFDAEMAGFDGSTEPGVDGGFSVTFDGRGDIASVQIVLSDGEVCGRAAIRQLADALLKADALAERMGR